MMEGGRKEKGGEGVWVFVVSWPNITFNYGVGGG